MNESKTLDDFFQRAVSAIDAGAALDGTPENALVNGNFAAAAHLVARGAPVSLATALCLARWDDVQRLGPTASAEDKQFGLVHLSRCSGGPSGPPLARLKPRHYSLDATELRCKGRAEALAKVICRVPSRKSYPMRDGSAKIATTGVRMNGMG
jgi:hypothetical protein